ncbi:hypothetical protein [Siminovitchia fordii]|uniref:Uncharacterized protein n=1 Tax=Siminovitchia fordii TaxID=254759 RepID=A0ABQ4KCF7_9BACI|nr:hypothetical protein [Siminovitchia fordii]GIN22558.1 hypothetical protein J1TS3_36920 [Siminovitchia fordii]
MSIEEIEKRFAKGYAFHSEAGIMQCERDMEWLMDEVIKLDGKYKNLIKAIIEAIEDNSKIT